MAMATVMTDSLFIVAFLTIVMAAGVCDLLTMTIPNRLSVGLVALFLIFAVVTGMPFETVGIHLLIAGGALLLGFGLFAVGGLGGGDSKLLAAVVLWLPPLEIPLFLFSTSLAGAVLALTMLAFRSAMLPARAARYGWVLRLHDKKIGIPYGIAIAAGTLIVVFQAWPGSSSLG